MGSRYQTVDEYLAAQSESRREEVEALRRLVLSADARAIEIVKWNSPSYVVDGADRVTVAGHNPRVVSLVLHRGAMTREDAAAPTSFDGDPDGLLTWHSDIRASIGFSCLDDIAEKSERVVRVLRRWLAT